MKVAIASDHGGFALKERLVKGLRADGVDIEDFGCHSEESVDYPDYALLVAKKVNAGDYDRGILLCGTGLGMCIVANKMPGIRAVTVHDLYSAKMTREHNDSNVLTMGGRVIDADAALEVARVWLATAYEGGRHERRLAKIRAAEDAWRATAKGGRSD